jgi:hypothetical protein
LAMSLMLLSDPGLATIALKVTLIPYMLLALIASFQQSLRYGVRLFCALPWLFFAYHLVYGLGGLWGVILLFFRRAPVQLHQGKAGTGIVRHK